MWNDILLLDKMGRYINKFGVELETISNGCHSHFWNIHSDPSIETKNDNEHLHFNEYVTEPLDYPAQVKTFYNEVKKLYEEIVEINDTMGLHIHLSFKNNDYRDRLISYRFYSYFMSRINELMNKLNEYERKQLKSRIEYNAYSKRNTKNFFYNMFKSRYRHINYVSLLDHTTIEFRLYPAMETTISVINTLNFTTRVVNSFLQKTNNLKYSVKSEINETNSSEEIINDKIKINKSVFYV